MSNANKKAVKKDYMEEMMKQPCTITEALKIGRAAAEDVISEYHQHQGNVQLAMSMQIEILKEMLFSSGVLNESEFKEKYQQKVVEVQKMQEEIYAEESAPKASADMSMSADINVSVEE